MRFRRKVNLRKPPERLSLFTRAGRGIRGGVMSLIHEDTLLLVVAGVAMVISYSALVSYARKLQLPWPELWPIPVDVAALAVTRVARKMQRLETKALMVRFISFVLVATSVGLQISLVELPALPSQASQYDVLVWLWKIVPSIIGHGLPGIVAFVLSELILMLQRAEAQHEQLVTEREREEQEREREQRRQRRQEPGQRRPVPVAAGTDESEEATAPPLSSDLTPELVGLADEVAKRLEGRATKRSTRPLILEIRKEAGKPESCSWDLAQKVANLVNARSQV